MTNQNFKSNELYKYIVVYNNVFEDPQRMYDIVKNTYNNKEEGMWGPWHEWSIFGDYITELGIMFDKSAHELILKQEFVPKNKTQEDQFYFVTELLKGFHLVNNDYIQRYGIDMETDNDTIIDTFGNEEKTWTVNGPTIAKYYVDAGNAADLAMRYHSDYIREPIQSPGPKFIFTTTTYINDDYEGGAIDFAIGKKLLKYKPKAGDFIVFPAGHPDYLTEDGTVYLHAVDKCTGSEKILTRMYWMKHYPASEEWIEKEKEFGKQKWAEMQGDIMDVYRQEYPQRNTIEGAVRIQ